MTSGKFGGGVGNVAGGAAILGSSVNWLTVIINLWIFKKNICKDNRFKLINIYSFNIPLMTRG